MNRPDVDDVRERGLKGRVRAGACVIWNYRRGAMIPARVSSSSTFIACSRTSSANSYRSMPARSECMLVPFFIKIATRERPSLP